MRISDSKAVLEGCPYLRICSLAFALPLVTAICFVVQLRMLTWQWAVLLIVAVALLCIVISIRLRQLISENPYYVELLEAKRQQVYAMREELINQQLQFERQRQLLAGWGESHAFTEEKTVGQKKAPE